jgi:hypothetical protein
VDSQSKAATDAATKPATKTSDLAIEPMNGHPHIENVAGFVAGVASGQDDGIPIVSECRDPSLLPVLPAFGSGSNIDRESDAHQDVAMLPLSECMEIEKDNPVEMKW